MTKYACEIRTENGWETVALFSDKVSITAMIDFALSQYNCGNSLETPYDAINIIDMNTGGILWDSWSHFHNVDDFEHADIDNKG